MNSKRVILAVVRSPVLWGTLAGVGFFSLVQSGTLGRSFFQRYCAGHPVNYTETFLFFVGLAVLAIKTLEVAAQRQGSGRSLLSPVPPGGQSPGEAESLLLRLDKVPAQHQGDYLVGRLREGLLYVARRQSAEGLGDHLKHLADLDAGRAHASYALLRLIVWAIPILGFLGTVIGITMAIASLRPSALEESMLEVTAGLGVAFDTTALALSLSIILMFVQYYVDRAETGLLDEVDRRVEAELVGRFPEASSPSAGDPAAVRRLSEQMVHNLELVVRKQADLWQTTLQTSHERWSRMADEAGRQLQTALASSLGESLKLHARESAEVRRFEETVAALSAAIHLLNARLGDMPVSDRARRANQAA